MALATATHDNLVVPASAEAAVATQGMPMAYTAATEEEPFALSHAACGGTGGVSGGGGEPDDVVQPLPCSFQCHWHQ
jgi:hypothetical protein